MCGIAGLVRFDGGALEGLSTARGMRARLARRGPDGQGEWADAFAVLEHTRLAIVDREGGVQPMRSRDERYVLTYNGELYDHEALRRELDYPFATRSDAETVLAAFAAWGEACVERFNGMFALAIWDRELRRLFLARDALGVKPLAYAWDGEELLFASEASAVAHGRKTPARICAPAFLEYLVAPYFSGVEHSMFDGVELLLPGHVAWVDVAGPRTRRYFRFRPALAAEADPPSAEQLGAALARAVERAQLGDVPIAACLSGGLDSTAIVAIASRCFAEVPRSFAIAFEGAAEYDYARSAIVVSDDLPFARLAAEATGSSLTEVAVAVDASDLERVATTNDAIVAWEQEVAQDRLARAVGLEHRCVLVGDAADETHFGYHFLLDAQATSSPRRILERFGPLPVRRDVLADPLQTFGLKYGAWLQDAGENENGRILGTSSLIVERWLPRLLHNGDIHFMRSSVEARVPFADLELLALAGRVSPAQGLAGGVEKALLREALRGVVPESIRLRRKSALPKPQDCAPLYRREAARLLREPPQLLTDFVDLEKLRSLLPAERLLDEWERAALFRAIMVCHFAHHHAIP